MLTDDPSRRLLHEKAVAALGTEAAAVLMDHLPPAGWSDLARRGDVEHGTALLRADLERQIGLVRSELTQEIGLVRSELTREIGLVRSELTQEIGLVRFELGRRFDLLQEQMGSMKAVLGAELSSAVAAQTRWMVTILTVLGALLATITVVSG